MKIAVNTRLLLSNKLEGIGRFSFELLKHIVIAHPEHEFHFIFDRPYAQEFIFADNVIAHVASPPARHPILWFIYFEFTIPIVLHKIKPDIFLSPDGWIPLHLKVKTIDVIHDLNFEHHPEFIKPVVRRYYQYFFHRFAKKADHIVTVSNFTRMDIHQLYDIPLDKISVVFNAANQIFIPLKNETKQLVRDEFCDGNPFFLFIGLIHKRKNLDNIFKAFDLFKIEDGKNTKLIVVGDKKWWKGDIENAFLEMTYKNDVVFMGHLPIEKVAHLMASAIALLYPSLFEGFGIPIVEAFCAETAVITSNITSMPEIAEDAAITVNPFSIAEIKDAMCLLVNDDLLRSHLINRGKILREKYSWKKSAQELWKLIESIS
ncbi:MAG: glycosyltransferase family 4 protein [Bacteroidales bacterium]|jgi:glycosyltransferase involved in cell wall biosynthesis|nr:glycosyltransferase family 4 protein [Bacteroidales bacterium]